MSVQQMVVMSVQQMVAMSVQGLVVRSVQGLVGLVLVAPRTTDKLSCTQPLLGQFRRWELCQSCRRWFFSDRYFYRKANYNFFSHRYHQSS